jgi:prepilin-type N-terminal cleavage/methylation domain-containing protein
MKQLRRAFSLIEISLVIVIISIIAAGILKTSTIVTKSRLQAARVLTQNSPVVNMPNLVLWYETCLESSFINSERSDGNSVSTWYDNNPNADSKNNATQTTSANQPVFYENVFYNNALPGLRFNGSSSYMSFNGNNLINNSYTIFIVEQRRSNSNNSDGFFIAGSGSSADTNLHLGYRSQNVITQAHYADDLNYSSIANYTSPVPRIHTFVFSTSGSTPGKRYWLNGSGNSSATNASATTQTTPLSSYSGSSIGHGSQYFNGDIAEIIMFSRSLTSTERLGIEIYLGKKYNIAVTTY